MEDPKVIQNLGGSTPLQTQGVGSGLKWTEGPWLLEIRGSEGLTSCGIYGAKPNPVMMLIINKKTGEVIDKSDPPDRPDPLFWSTGSYVGKTSERDIANGHLAAAAPELYEALSSLLAAAELHGTDGLEFFEARNTGLAVLAKARGEASEPDQKPIRSGVEPQDVK